MRLINWSVNLTFSDKLHKTPKTSKWCHLATAFVVFSCDWAKTLWGEDLDDDGAVAGEDDTEWDEVSEQSVDPVPRTDEELDKLIVQTAVQIGVGGVTSCWRVDVQVEREKEVHVGAKEQNRDDGPGDDDTTTGTVLFALEWQPDRYKALWRQQDQRPWRYLPHENYSVSQKKPTQTFVLTSANFDRFYLFF